MTAGSVVVPAALTEVLGPPPAGVTVIPVPRRRRAGRSGVVDWEPIVLAVAGASPESIMLVLPGELDPAWPSLRQIAVMLGRPLITLQPDPVDAAWTTAVAFGLVGTAPERLVRMLEVLAGGPAVGPVLPRRPWQDGRAVPALRPETLGRWAECTWRACPWCAGGGVPAGRCGRCLAPIPGEVDA